jgi:glycosyltransferase involved in cell wall biosynthesis
VDAKILIISPVRNEAAHIERVVRSVAAQELPPARWIVLDDNSTDGTRELLESLAKDVPFMDVQALGASHAQRRPGTSTSGSPWSTGVSTRT